MRRRALVSALAIALFASHCSRCSAPKPTPEDDPSDLDAAPREETLRARCGDAPIAHVALPATSDAAFELGRVRSPQMGTSARVVIGARRGDRAGLLEVDALTARFTETSDAHGDVPPPVPVVTAERAIAIAYEDAGKNPKGRLRLVARDAASSATPLFALDPEPPDDSLAYDAIALADGTIVVAWDAPDADQNGGSAIWARAFRNGRLGDATRISPKDVDADTPRLVAFGPTLVAFWIAHRPLAPTARHASPEPEGPGEDLDRAWIEMLGLDAVTLAPTSPLRHVTPDTGRVSAFDVLADATSALPAMNVLARDAIELHAGQGGSALFVHVQGPDPAPPIVLSNHVGRGLPLYLPSRNLLLFNDASEVGRTASDAGVAAEAFSGERPLAALTTGEILLVKDRATDLDVFRCGP